VFKWIAAAAGATVVPLIFVFAAIAGAVPGSAGTSLAGGPATVALSDIPPVYLSLFMGAAQTCPGLPWGVLAGIGKIESDDDPAPKPPPGLGKAVNTLLGWFKWSGLIAGCSA
jgi:hypothetical protein